jgi:GNAT superfamily N-acetyltransferase
MNDIENLCVNDKHICRHELENIINLNRVYVIAEKEEFIGWLRYGLFWDNTPFMNLLYLLEDSRGKGVGSKIVEHWEKDMKALGYESVMTSTASDEYSQHFYVKLGYKTIGGFLQDGNPFEIILAKNL